MPNTPTAATGKGASTLDPQETVRPARRVPATSLLLVVVLVLVAAVAGVVALLRRTQFLPWRTPSCGDRCRTYARGCATPLASAAADDAAEFPITRVSGSAAEVSPPSDRGASYVEAPGVHTGYGALPGNRFVPSRHSPAGLLIRPAMRFD